MSKLIYESIITTLSGDGSVHIAPMGVWQEDDLIVLAPFRPSTTLDNLVRSGNVVVNASDDVRVFAGCLTGRRDWPTRPATRIEGRVLAAALAHVEYRVERINDDSVRPCFYCREVHRETHAPFPGFNRAQAAVIEAAILVSRLHMLSSAKIEREIDYLSIAIDKTAGPREREAWAWLLEKIAAFRAENKLETP